MKKSKKYIVISIVMLIILVIILLLIMLINKRKNNAENVYENSPLSLIEKGDFLKIQSNQDFLLNFIFIKNNAPNYDYQKVN